MWDADSGCLLDLGPEDLVGFVARGPVDCDDWVIEMSLSGALARVFRSLVGHSLDEQNL